MRAVGNMKMMKLLICLVLTALVSGCGAETRTVEVTDVTKSETIALKKDPGQGAIHSLTVKGKGRIDGNAEIVLILNGGPYRTERLSGRVDFRWGGDWYSDQAEIRYRPTSPTGGSLSLEYKFNDIE
jgi:hypothetical protein